MYNQNTDYFTLLKQDHKLNFLLISEQLFLNIKFVKNQDNIINEPFKITTSHLFYVRVHS